MTAVLEHRGPDDTGFHVEDRAGLGHRRLSIVDLRGGHQPMSTDDGRYHVSYNGEIYNHLELRRSIDGPYSRFHTRCDTEALLRLFATEGPTAVERFRGMFAFAIWDSKTETLSLARDRVGIKPLYYSILDDGTLVFGSEIKALLAGELVEPRLNFSQLPDYLANHATSGSETLVAGVQRLPPGHVLTWRSGTTELKRYWKPSFRTHSEGPVSDSDLVAEFGRLFEDSVSARLMADVPLGVFLSGGIDSASIAATMSEMVDDPIKTFSVAFDHREANELRYARAVAEAYSTDHHEVVIGPDEFFGALPELIWHEDEPLAHPSSVPLYFVARLAQKHAKVVLTGEGSDELLGGYGRYPKTLANLRFAGWYQRFVPEALRQLSRESVRRLPESWRIRQLADRSFICRSPDIASLYLDNFAVFPREAQRRLLSPSALRRCEPEDAYSPHRSVLDSTDADNLLNTLLHLDLSTYLHELLMKQDQMSMAASIESRVPFLDQNLVEFATRLPVHMKIRRTVTKRILREAMRGKLPDVILSRSKMGFPVPFGHWIRHEWHSTVRELLTSSRARERKVFDQNVVDKMLEDHRRGRLDHAEKLWSLVNFELWCRTVLEGDRVNLTSEPIHVGQGTKRPDRSNIPTC